MTNLQKNETIQKIRTAVREILIKLKLRKPNGYENPEYENPEYERNMRGVVSEDIPIVLGLKRSFFESDDSIYGSIYDEYSNTKKKRLPNTGTNFSKTPILFEIPKINNPAAWVSSKTQNDTKPIKN